MSERETKAATVIQKHFRGYLARKLYTEKLLVFFQEDEERRREKERVQMLEGEILLEKHRLRHNIADSKTLNQNEERRVNMMAIRIQQAWKKYKESKNRHTQGLLAQGLLAQGLLAQANVLSGVHTNKTSTAGVVNDCVVLLNRLQSEKKSCDSDPLVSDNSSDSACHTNNKLYVQDHNDTKTDAGLSTTSASEVRRLASQVKSILLQDDSTELEMFESPEDIPFEGVSIRISSQTRALTDNNLETETSATHIPDQISQNSQVEDPQSNSTAVNEKRKVILKVGGSLTNLDTLGSRDMHIAQSGTDSSVKWIQHAFKSGTSHDHLPMSMKILDDDSLKLSVEGVTSPEDRYRLCYTIELSDSSSEEGGNIGTQSYSERINFSHMTSTMGGNLEENTFISNHHLHEFTFEDFVCDDDQTFEQTTEHRDNDFEVGRAEYTITHCKQMDHRTSPLFTMTLEQLRELLLSLKRQLSDHSTTLIQLLEERDALKNENKLLNENIAQLARRVQNLYITS